MKNRFSLTLALLLMLGSSISLCAQTQTDSVALEPGKSIERTIAGGETHSYTLALGPGMYGLVDVHQRSINVEITVFAADGQKLRIADLNSVAFAEQISLIAADAFSYRFEVSAHDKTGRPGSYAIQLKETRPATDQDKARIEGEKLSETGMQLIYKQAAESIREAVDKFQQSLAFWQTAKDKSKEARALYLMGYGFNLLGEFQKAFDAAQQGLQLAQAANDRELEAYIIDTLGSSYNGRGERRKALEYFLQALPLRSQKDPIGLGNTLNNIGIAYAWIGERTKALGYIDHEIVTLPSASVLAVLREETANRKPASKAVAVLADPVFSASDPRLAQAAKGAVDDNASLVDAQRSAAESGVASLVRLRFSRQEAEEIARLAGDRRNLKALDFSANRAMATDAKLSDYRIVHFATHGLINNHHPDLSGVVLSLVDEQGRSQNGFLRLYDIYNLKLNADLVVLSACQTALGKEIKGEGLVGLTRGFMYAGAPRVVASLWRIDDRATADIMKRFYEAMLRDGLRPAAALRAAQVSMFREKRWQSPHYWAAFTMQGEWRQD